MHYQCSQLIHCLFLPFQLFDRLRKETPKALEKLVLVEGDVSKDRLGLDDDIYQSLAENVDVVFHSAATVKFTTPLKQAILINTKGTRETLNLSLAMKKLKV